LRQPIPFGKYFLLERINVGGMAEVFKAKATGVEGFERLVAVKRILPSIAEDEEFILMFVDEAKIAVQLTHANIAQIFDLGRVEGSFFIALEYVHGKDMRAIFNRARQRAEPLPIPLSCYAIMKMCEGLDYAHNKHDGMGTFLNLVHRDVSPQNILISYEGEVKIIDFGIAKAAGKVGRTQAGILKGKFGYMSPEQVLGLEIDRRSDIFGVGICLYELLTGERLFVAESDFATLEKVRSVDIMPPSTYNRRIPEELEQIVMRALARDRDRRHQTALQLHDELQAFMHTSANLFSRKDLAQYMHRVFAEEIEKETARDKEYAAMDPRASELEDAGLAAFDQIDPVSTVSALSAQPSYGIIGAAPASAHSRKPTLLGMPQLSMRQDAVRAPSVPRLVPAPHSVPPSVPRHARPSAPLQIPGVANHPGMEWDDEELSTQIYDKPDDPRPEYDPAAPPEFASQPPSYGSQPPAFASQPRWTPPDLSQTVQEGMPFPRPNVAYGAQAGYPATAASTAEFAAASGASAPFTLGAHASGAFPPGPPPTHPFAQVRPVTHAQFARTASSGDAIGWEKPKGRPMFVAAMSVVAIITSIVIGLLLFGQRDPGTLHLVTVPARVSVSVDGRPLGVSTSPFVIGELSAGRRHSIMVNSPGYRPWSTAVELQAGQVLALPEVKLEAIETGFALESQPSGATVYIDGSALAQRTPARVTDLSPGEHRIRLELNGYAGWESAFNASTGTVLPLQTVTLQPLPSEPVATNNSRYSRSSRLHASSSSGSASSDGASDSASRSSRSSKPAAPAEASDGADEAPSTSSARASKPIEPAEEAAEDEPAKPEAKPEVASADEAQGVGTLRVNTRPWSKVSIDGKPYGNTPKMNIELPAGEHTLTFVNEEFGIRKSVPVTITSGQVQSVVLNLTE
jgi:eukaryotic-like serine/threonine-protein kinase